MDHSAVASSEAFVSSPTVNPKRLIAGYYSVFIVLGLIMMALGATLAELATRTNSQFHEISYSFIARSLGFFLGSLFGGRVYDRFSGHKLLSGALAMMALLSAFVPVAPGLSFLIGLFLVQGLFGSLINVGGNTLLVWARLKNVGALLTGLHFCWGLGSAISPLIVEQVENLSGDINWAYWVLSLMALPVCLGLLRLPSPTNPMADHHESLGRVNLPLALMIAGFFFLYTGLEASIISWIHTYTMQAGMGDKSAAYKLNSVFLLVFTFGRLLAIPIASRLRPRTILVYDFCGCFLSIGAILLWPASVTVLWIASCSLGLSMASVFPTMFAFAERRMHLSGKLTGYLFSASSGGSMVMPFLVGQYFESIGPQVLFYIVTVALAAGFVIFSVMMMLYPSHSDTQIQE